jgi:hypothetical protein
MSHFGSGWVFGHIMFRTMLFVREQSSISCVHGVDMVRGGREVYMKRTMSEKENKLQYKYKLIIHVPQFFTHFPAASCSSADSEDRMCRAVAEGPSGKGRIVIFVQIDQIFSLKDDENVK